MPIVSGATHDVFVSYASINDASYEDASPGWVTRVVNILRNDLGQRLARSDSDLYFSNERRETGRLESTLKKHVSGAACLLFVLSRASLRSTACLLEFSAFLEAHPRDYADRLVIVDMDSPLSSPGFLTDLTEESAADVLPSLQRLLAECHSQIRIECFRKVGAGRICPVDHPPEGPGSNSRYLLYQKVADIGVVISEKLLKLRRNARNQQRSQIVQVRDVRGANGVRIGAVTDTSTAAVKIPVFIALGTTGAREYRDELLRTLDQNQHIEVRPANAQHLWPSTDGAAAFRAGVEELVRRSRLFVMLLGGRVPGIAVDPRFAVPVEDMPDEYLEIQLRLAEQYQIKPLIWCSPDVEDDSLEPAEVLIRSSRSVIEDTLEVFKRHIDAHIQRILRTVTARSVTPTNAAIFLNFAEQDRDLAEPLIERYAQRYTLFTPAKDASPAEMRELNDDFYRSCDAAIFLDRNAPGRWMEAQLIQFIKVRGSRVRPLSALAAVRSEERPRPAVSVPGLQWLTVPSSADSSMVSPMLDSVLTAIA